MLLPQVESNAVRCPDSEAAERMYEGEPALLLNACFVSGCDLAWTWVLASAILLLHVQPCCKLFSLPQCVHGL